MSENIYVAVLGVPKNPNLMSDFAEMLHLNMRNGHVVVILPSELPNLREVDVENITSQLRKMVNHDTKPAKS